MHHDPEQLAARFLDGAMRRPERWRFERHLVECSDCWAQVQRARDGRNAAESLRVVAPARVRDRIRAIPELAEAAEPLVPRSHRRMPLLVAAIVTALVAVVVAVAIRDDADPGQEAVTEVAAAYRETTAWAVSNAKPPMRLLSGLRWTQTETTAIDSDRVLGFRYSDGRGNSVLVIQRDGAFETPPQAQSVRGGEWVTEVDGVTVFCTHLANSVLVVGDEPDLVAKAARTLTEHES